MAQEALARLETTRSLSTASALIGMAQQQSASFDDIADTLHHWAARQDTLPGLSEHLTGLLVEATDPNIQALAAVGLAGGGNRAQAQATLVKLLQHVSPDQKQRIRYAMDLLGQGSK
jgi:LAS superfamily LD-carboxypeptidase LdcB